MDTILLLLILLLILIVFSCKVAIYAVAIYLIYELFKWITDYNFLEDYFKNLTDWFDNRVISKIKDKFITSSTRMYDINKTLDHQIISVSDEIDPVVDTEIYDRSHVNIQRYDGDQMRSDPGDFIDYEPYGGADFSFEQNMIDADDELTKRQIYSGSQLKRARENAARNKIELARVLYADEIDNAVQSQWHDFDQTLLFDFDY